MHKNFLNVKIECYRAYFNNSNYAEYVFKF